jgi:hypothetical protein
MLEEDLLQELWMHLGNTGPQIHIQEYQLTEKGRQAIARIQGGGE